MRLLAALLLACLLASPLRPALAQRAGGQGHGMSDRELAQRPMPPAERRLGWEERQRLREQVRNGQMTRDEARQLWREQRAADPRFSPEHRDQLRRDVQDANRDLKR